MRIPDLLTLSEYEEPLEAVWSALTRLDLSGCRLGDRHPALAQIATATRYGTYGTGTVSGPGTYFMR